VISAHPAEIVLVDLCSAMINASTQALVREVANEFNLSTTLFFLPITLTVSFCSRVSVARRHYG